MGHTKSGTLFSSAFFLAFCEFIVSTYNCAPKQLCAPGQVRLAIQQLPRIKLYQSRRRGPNTTAVHFATNEPSELVYERKMTDRGCRVYPGKLNEHNLIGPWKVANRFRHQCSSLQIWPYHCTFAVTLSTPDFLLDGKTRNIGQDVLEPFVPPWNDEWRILVNTQEHVRSRYPLSTEVYELSTTALCLCLGQRS